MRGPRSVWRVEGPRRDEGWVSAEGRPMLWQALGPQDVSSTDYTCETGQAWVRADGETFPM